MDYQQVLAMPLKTFWSYNRQVDRLRAEQDQRLFRLMNASQNPEAAQALAKSLSAEIESPTVIERGFDEDKFLELKERFEKGA